MKPECAGGDGDGNGNGEMMDGDGWTGHCHGCSIVVPHQLIMDTGVAEMQIKMQPLNAY